MIEKISAFIREKSVEINQNNPSLQNYLKKDYIVQVTCLFYDNFIDKPANLPRYIDSGVKIFLIPFLADWIIMELKNEGIITNDK